MNLFLARALSLQICTNYRQFFLILLSFPCVLQLVFVLVDAYNPRYLGDWARRIAGLRSARATGHDPDSELNFKRDGGVAQRESACLALARSWGCFISIVRWKGEKGGKGERETDWLKLRNHWFRGVFRIMYLLFWCLNHLFTVAGLPFAHSICDNFAWTKFLISRPKRNLFFCMFYPLSRGLAPPIQQSFKYTMCENKNEPVPSPVSWALAWAVVSLSTAPTLLVLVPCHPGCSATPQSTATVSFMLWIKWSGVAWRLSRPAVLSLPLQQLTVFLLIMSGSLSTQTCKNFQCRLGRWGIDRVLA